MRYIIIDLSSDNDLEQPNLFGGYEGEHNETILQVKLPKRMIDIECSGYRFDFQTSEDNKISSPLIPISELNNDILSFHLTQQLTIAGKLLFNVIAILSDENTVSMISKTNTVTLRIEDAVDGNMQLIDPNGYKDELQKMVDERIMEINPAKVDQTYSPISKNAQSGKAVSEAVSDKQDSLVSGTNIKTINNQSILGSGNITIEGGSDVEVDQTYSPNSENAQSGTAVAEALSGYVVAEVGKGLSSNDFTNEDKEKLYSALQNENIDQTYTSESTNAQSGKAVAEALSTEQNRADNTFANALKGSKNDTAILLDDISPVTHEMGVKVRGKNLFDKSIPYEDYTPKEGGYKMLSIYVGSGSTVTVSLKQKHDIGLGGYFYCIAFKSGVAGASQEWLYHNSNTSLCNKSVTMISEDSHISLIMTVDAYNNFKDEIMVEIGTTASAYTPYVPDLTAVKVIRCGKNLSDINRACNDSISANAYDTFSINDNVITATSDNSTTKVVIMNLFNGELPAGDYILSLNAVIENTPKHRRPNEILIFKNNSVITLNNSMGKDGSYSPTVKFTLSEKAKIRIDFYKSINVSQETVSDTVYKVTFSNIQLELGTTVTEYEPYITPTEYTPTADGIVEGVLSLYPNTALMTDTDGVLIDCEYNRDINKAFAVLEAAIATNNS